jgi:hypothetical protein
MKPPVDKIVLSTNTDPKYIEFWPIMSRAWRALLGVEPELVIVLDGDLPNNIKPGDNVRVVPLIHGIPAPNQAKMARHYVAAQYQDSVVMINDIDLLPINKPYIERMLRSRVGGQMLAYGTEHYWGSERGKWWLPYTTAPGWVFRKLLNPDDKPWEDFIRSFIGIQKFDSKENIANSIDHEDPACFSDESLYRYCHDLRPVLLHHVRRPHYPGSTLDRANWTWSFEDIKAGNVYDAHLPRPFSAHRSAIQPLLDYLYASLQ